MGTAFIVSHLVFAISMLSRIILEDFYEIIFDTFQFKKTWI